jgi:PAS domain S-box-containing protein
MGRKLKTFSQRSTKMLQQWVMTWWQRVTRRQCRQLELELKQANQNLLAEIAERQRTEEALRLSEARYEIAVAASKVGVWDWNVAAGEIYLAPNLEALLGYDEHEIPNTEAGVSLIVHADDLQYLTEHMYAYCAGKAAWYEVKFRALKKDGTFLWVMSRGSIISRDVNGVPTRIAGSITDITRLQQAEEDIERALAKEKELNELKSRFTSNTSHEFRTPLSVILSSAELLQHYGHEWTPEKKQELFNAIQTSVMEITQLLEDML